MRPCTPSARSGGAPGGFARAQVAVQGDERVGQRRLCGQPLGPGGGVVLAAPGGGGLGVPGLSTIWPVCGATVNSFLKFRSGPASWDSPKSAWPGWIVCVRTGIDAWLAQGFHGDMHYMAAHGLKRAARPSWCPAP